MVENTTAFESISSFSVGDSVSIVSHTGSDLNSISSHDESAGLGGTGILILDGESTTMENSKKEGESSVLSLPGTDSLPSDIGTIQVDAGTVDLEDPEAQHKITIYKHHILMFFSFFAVFISYGVFEWSSLRSVSLKQQQQLLEAEETILRLEQEAEELRLKSKQRIDYSDDSEYYTIVDNCWIKAKTKWCDKKTAPSNPFSLPLFLGEMAGEKLRELTDAIKEVPDSASAATEETIDVLSDFFGTVGKVMTSELQQLSDNPVDYFATAVNGAVRNSESQKVTMNGFQEAVDTMASLSNEFGEAFKKSFAKMAEALEEPLKNLETKPTKA